MEEERIIDTQSSELYTDDEENGYIPRNSVVAAKEKLYDRANVTVAQVDKFIIGCVAMILVLVVFGIMH